jgi:hypothetical protein
MGMDSSERIPALGTTESLAKTDSLANLLESFEKPQDRLREFARAGVGEPYWNPKSLPLRRQGATARPTWY